MKGLFQCPPWARGFCPFRACGAKLAGRAASGASAPPVLEPTCETSINDRNETSNQ